jgi:hypothetical protein
METLRVTARVEHGCRAVPKEPRWPVGNLFHRQFLAIAALALAVCAQPSTPMHAAQPKVDFDLRYQVECNDVTERAFARSHPDEKMLEAKVRISVRLVCGEEKDIDQLLFEIISPGERLRVIDFLPKTQLESEAADGVQVIKTIETTRSVGATAGTGFSFSTGGDKNHASACAQILPSASANGSTTHHNALTETSKKIPPGKVVVASGTMDNEHGVFFKLKRSDATSFEDTKLVSFRFVVPSDWRGDWVVVLALARGTFKRSLFFKAVEPCGETKAFVGLYLAGDAAAERASLQLAESQERLVGSGEKEQLAEIITEMVRAASPWQIAKSRPAVKPSHKLTLRACRRPFALGDFFVTPEGAGRATEHDSGGEPTTVLKQAINRMAKLSGAG